jgi:acetyl esterase/lipase
MPSPPYPLHESIVPRLDPEYADFYNKHIINHQQTHYQPISVSRASGIIIPGAGPPRPVAKTQDLTIPRAESSGPDVSVRCFTPLGEAPEGGWPVMLWIHGGGWVLGNIDTENVICTHLCNRAKCVAITTDYR